MKSMEEMKEEIGGKFSRFSDLDKYMVEAGYHSNLPDADLDTIAKDEAVIYLGEEEEAEIIIDLLITRWNPFPDAFGMIIKDIHVLDE